MNEMPADTVTPAPTVSSAARNNAEWCAAVCRTHAIPYEVDDAAWSSPRRTPAYYPDAVTLRPDAREDDVLRRIDTSWGCSVKDSFATLDLTAHGFTPLLHGRWFHRPASEPATAPGTGPGKDTDTGIPNKGEADACAATVRDPERLAAWISAWHGGGVTPDGEVPAVPDVFRPSLLLDPEVRVLAVRDRDGGSRGPLVGGAVLNLGAGLVGVTNVFTVARDATPRVWSAVVRGAAEHFPHVPLVGYAAATGAHAATGPAGTTTTNPGPATEIPLPPGFRPLGSLRVWLRQDA
jgi:hypothetical protein